MDTRSVERQELASTAGSRRPAAHGQYAHCPRSRLGVHSSARRAAWPLTCTATRALLEVVCRSGGVVRSRTFQQPWTVYRRCEHQIFCNTCPLLLPRPLLLRPAVL